MKNLNTSPDQETLVIGRVIKELEKIPQERIPEVMSYITGRLIGSPIKGTPQSPQASSGIAKGIFPGEKIYDFVKRKAPVNNYQTAAALGYFIEEAEGMTDHNTAAIVQASRDARLPSTNWAQVITDAQTKYRFFTKGMKKGTRRLTSTARDIVEALPDQEQVKNLSHRARSGGRKRSERRKKRDSK